MFINYQALLLGTASLLCGLVAAENKFDAQFEGGRCAKSIMNDYMRVGGERGDMFCEQRSDWGGVVTGIEVWANQEGVNGLKFYFCKCANPVIGRTLYTHWIPTISGWKC